MQAAVEQARLIEQLTAEITRLKEELAALGQWQCQSCGCRFAKAFQGPEAVLSQIMRCSSCVQVEVLEARLAEKQSRSKS